MRNVLVLMILAGAVGAALTLLNGRFLAAFGDAWVLGLVVVGAGSALLVVIARLFFKSLG